MKEAGAFRRIGFVLLRQLAGAMFGGALGIAVQLATGVAGWGVVGLCLGVASVSVWLAIRDPRR
jgi:hypothetical protein